LVWTRGSASTLCWDGEGWIETPSLRVRPVDTVGAGDAFAGALAAALARGEALREALAWANAAGALTTLGEGAQEAMPGREATRRAMGRLRKGGG